MIAAHSKLARASVERLLGYQHANGSFVASPDFAEYDYCWLRDTSFVAYALDLAGEHQAASRFHGWVGRTLDGIAGVIDEAIAQHRHGFSPAADAMPPARFSLDGRIVVDDWPNFQVDGYGTWLWALGEHVERTDQPGLPEKLVPSVARVADYVAAFALSPCFDVWEEHGTAVHTSTLGCVYGGLTAAAALLGRDDLTRRAAEVQAIVRERAESAGYHAKSTESTEVDSSTLWLSTPFGLVEPDDHRFDATVLRIEEHLTLDGGIRRYPSDTYYGGGAWPVLTASLGWHYTAVGNVEAAVRCLDWVAGHFEAGGELAEQFGGGTRDPEHFREWVERWGPSARDLLWSHAMYVVLCDALNGLNGPAENAAAGESNGSTSTARERSRS
jgi:GH15 family glucan-1,4-alpha-glucosidase